MIGRLIYIAFKPIFLKHYFNDQSKKLGFENMKKEFIDSNGKAYYSVVNDFEMPHERTKAIELKVMRIASGLSDSELDKFYDAMEKALSGGKKPDIAMIGFLIKEMRLRKDILIHPEVMMDIVALRYIREDENPEIIDMAIHKEKVEQFNKDSKGGLYHFFQQAGLGRYIPYLTKLEKDWDEYYLESEIKIKVMNQMLNQYIIG